MEIWLGIDGGGSKTDFQLVCADGRVLGMVTLGGINPNYCTKEDVQALLEAGKTRLFFSAGLDAATHLRGAIICLAGFSPEVCERFGSMQGFGEIYFSGDHLPLLELCGNDENCVVIHSGTGSFVSSRLADSSVRFWGGYGYLLHDPGSGADIGRRAVRRTFEEYTGVAPKTDFGERIRAFYGFQNFEHLVELVYENKSPACTLGKCVRVVMELLGKGDREAREIVTASLGELAALALKVSREFPSEPCRRGLSGGVLTVPSAAHILRKELCARGLSGQWNTITQRPIEGVRRMLVKWAQGKHPDKRYRNIPAVLT